MKTSSNQFLKLSASTAGFLGILCFLAATACAQEKNPQRGFQPGNAYAISDIESINTTNGNLMLHVPLGQLPPGRGSLSAGISLRYNSKLYDSKVQELVDMYGHSGPQNVVVPSAEGGWNYGFNYTLEILNRNNINPSQCPDPKAFFIWKVQLVYPDGGAHQFRPLGYYDFLADGYYGVNPDTGEIRNCSGTTGYAPNSLTYYSTDGTYTRLTINRGVGWTLSFADGSRVVNESLATRGLQSSVGDKLYDRNNNYLSFGPIEKDNHSGYGVFDQFGRYVMIEPHDLQDNIYSRGFNDHLLMWTVKWKWIYVRRTYHTTADSSDLAITTDQEYTNSIRVVDSITLPSQLGDLKYQFSYSAPDSISTTASDGWGQVSGVRLPSLAQVGYQYSTDGNFGQTTRIVLDGAITQKTLAYQPEYDLTATPTPSPTPIVDTWSYGGGASSTISSITAPDGGRTTYFYNDTTIEFSSSGLVYKEIHPDGEVIERLWQPNAPHRVVFGNDAGANYYVKTEFRSVGQFGSLVKTAIKDYTFDKNGNQTSVAEYDWVDYSSVPRTSNRPTGIPPGARLIRLTTNTYARPTRDASDSTSDEADAYWNSGSVSLRNAIVATEVAEISGGAVQTRARTEFVYDDATTTGNLTKKSSWDSAKGSYTNPLNTSNSISVASNYTAWGSTATDPPGGPPSGKLTQTTDARGTPTVFTYDSVGGFDIYPTQIQIGTSVQHKETRDYDFSTGLVTRITDDNQVSTVTDYDDIGRPVLVRAAQGKLEESDTVTVYSDINRRVIVRSDLSNEADGTKRVLVSIQHYDQLGRVRLSRQLEDPKVPDETDETVGIKVQTRYLFADSNRYQVVSNPYRAATSGSASGELSMGWTRTKMDNGGRVIELQNYSGAALPAPWNANGSGGPGPGTGTVTTEYNANFVTVTDQAGKVRRSLTDGIGRLVRVDEPDSSNNLGPTDTPTQATVYDYDALSNLKTVTQGSQVRAFSYSSLSRLISATNVESGTISYEYDENGNLKTKTDPRQIAGPTPNTQLPVTTIYVYDELNRIQKRTYNDGTPEVTYTYDTVTNGKGRLSSITSSVSTYDYTGYDALGRITASRQTTNGLSYPAMAYTYNLAGSMTSETYPSGRVVSTMYDGAGRIVGVKNQGSGTYYAGGSSSISDGNRILYAPHGAIQALRLGNALWEHTNFNSRLQVTEIDLGATPDGAGLMSLTYGYGTTTNNGNVQSQVIIVPAVSNVPGFTATQTYSYDQLNRLSAAQEDSSGFTTWKQVYSYDRYGNRNLAGGTTLPTALNASTNPTIRTSDNRIDGNAPFQGNVRYDDAGNLITDVDGRSFGYDAANLQVSYNGGDPQNGGANYSYDGEGRRVKKVTSGGTTIFVYDVMGHLIAEYNTATQTSSGTSYLTEDALGTPRIITAANGSILARHDYLPFGEELYFDGTGPSVRKPTQMYVGDNVRQKFTQKERDTETGLDYFGARYYSAAQGRFTSADAPFADQHPNDAQSWNSYEYVRNNPLKNTDPNGKDCTDGLLACGNFILGGVGAAVNAISSNVINAPNRLIDTVISPFTNFRFGDVVPAAFTPTNQDQRQGMEAADAMMLLSPFAEAGATALVKTIGTGSRVEATAATTGKTLQPGPFAGESIPARGPQPNFTAAERAQVNKIGETTGCHTCGTTNPGTKGGNFVLDHQPPSALNPSGGKQQLYPHCLHCSQTQGGEVRQVQRKLHPPPRPRTVPDQN